MDILQVGLGSFGFNWLKEILMDYEGIRIVGLVDSDGNMLEKAGKIGGIGPDMLFQSINGALSKTRPDMILNTTPPHIHKEINLIALEHGIPVLCEKPIAEDFEDVKAIIEKAQSTGVPVMIAENYRFSDVVRKTKEIIDTGEIGNLNSIYVDFYRNHRMTNYHKDLKHPLLLDVSMHHMDMLRYIAGSEAKKVTADAWMPSWSWYTGFSNAVIYIEMDSKVKVSYRGSLSAPNNDTGWLGNWRIEGAYGTIEMTDNKIVIKKDGTDKIIHIIQCSDSRKSVLHEFIQSLKESRPGETDIKDNFKTFQIIQSAIESINKP